MDYTKLKLGELFPKDPVIHVKAYLETKKVQGVHILIGGFMEPIFSPFFHIFDPSTNIFRYWGNGDEVMEELPTVDFGEAAHGILGPERLRQTV